MYLFIVQPKKGRIDSLLDRFRVSNRKTERTNERIRLEGSYRRSVSRGCAVSYLALLASVGNGTKRSHD